MAYHPGTGLVYLPVMEALFVFEDVEAIDIEPGLRNRGIKDAEDPPGDAHFYSRLQKRLVAGHLLAWDPRKQEEAWRAPQGIGWNGGLLATAGDLVFQGGGDGFFRARRADDGKLLWSFPAQSGVIATPITYSVDGKQYVTVLAGWGGSFGLMSGIARPPGPKNGRVLTFALDGEAELPPVPAPAEIPEPPPPLDVPESEIERGGALYARYCAFCHGTGVVSGGTVPDLRRLPGNFHRNFDAIVRLGVMRNYGMPSFGDVLDEDDVQAIHAFVIDEAHADAKHRNAPAWWNAILDFFYDVIVWLMMVFLEPSVHSA
jgi:quinohemoprotein ethanol dehydrogenase